MVLRLLAFAGFASKGLYVDFREDELSGPLLTWGSLNVLWTEGIGRPRDRIDSFDSCAGSVIWKGSLLAKIAELSLEAALCFICCGDPLRS